MVKVLIERKEFEHQIRLSHPETGNTPLHEASLSGNAEIVNELIQKYSKQELFKVLTEKEYQNVEESSPLHIACRKGYFEIVELFFERIDKKTSNVKILANATGKKRKTPLHYACEYGDESVIALLKSSGASILRNENGSYPIHVAAQYGHWRIVGKLLDGITIDEVDDYQNTPLNIATGYGRVEMIEKLLEDRCEIYIETYTCGTVFNCMWWW